MHVGSAGAVGVLFTVVSVRVCVLLLMVVCVTMVVAVIVVLAVAVGLGDLGFPNHLRTGAASMPAAQSISSHMRTT